MTATFAITFILLLISGMPIAFVLGICAVVMLVGFSHTPILMVPELMYNSLASFPLMAIPFFMVAANFMAKGGTSRYLIEAANALVGRFSGGLAIVCVLASMVFAAICGSSVATALAMGVIIIPAMIKQGYTRSFSAGLVAASGTMGILIPPSIPLILYGIMADESIPRLFIAGVLPGIMQGLLYIGWIVFFCKKRQFGKQPPLPWPDVLRAQVKALPAFSLPVIIIGGIYTGIVTVTEAAALGAVASIVISTCIYRECRPQDILRIFGESMRSAGMIMFIIATAMVFGTWLTEVRIPFAMVEWVKDFDLPWWGFLLAVNLVLIILGMFLEVVSIMLITLPILIPMIHALGIDPVHFSIVMTINMELALITPPVGLNLYVLSNVSKAPLSETVQGVIPFMVLSMLQLLLVTYWPDLSLFLPRLLM